MLPCLVPWGKNGAGLVSNEGTGMFPKLPFWSSSPQSSPKVPLFTTSPELILHNHHVFGDALPCPTALFASVHFPFRSVRYRLPSPSGGLGPGRCTASLFADVSKAAPRDDPFIGTGGWMLCFLCRIPVTGVLSARARQKPFSPSLRSSEPPSSLTHILNHVRRTFIFSAPFHL